MEEENILEFQGTVMAQHFGNWTVALQEYFEYNGEYDEEGENDGKTIYNVALEYEVDCMWSETIDLFEDYDYEKVENYYKMICENINKVNHAREEEE